MKLNKIIVYILVWLIHIYIYFGTFILYTQYQTNVIHRTFYNLSDVLALILVIPFSILFMDNYIIFFSIFLMILLINHQKLKFMKSYIISVFVYLFIYLLLFLINQESFIYNLDWLVCLSALATCVIVIFLLFRKTFKRLDIENNLK